MSEWISVEKRLPTQAEADRAGYVLVWREDGNTDFCKWRDVPNGCVTGRTYTHWMPLPEPPEV